MLVYDSVASLKGKTILVETSNIKIGVLEEKLPEFKEVYPSANDFFVDYFHTLQKHTLNAFTLIHKTKANASSLPNEEAPKPDFILRISTT
jgi:hypothetical protein